MAYLALLAFKESIIQVSALALITSDWLEKASIKLAPIEVINDYVNRL